jgi:monothiol glutaredoxin
MGPPISPAKTSITSLCCWMRLKPAKAGDTTVARKWSPPPVQSSTSALDWGMAVSMRTSAALNALGVRYAAMDILPDPRIREQLSTISDWPTIPQLFVGGKLVGGCDIVTEMYETGELAELLGVEQPEDVEPEPPSVDPPVQSAPLGLENRLSD